MSRNRAWIIRPDQFHFNNLLIKISICVRQNLVPASERVCVTITLWNSELFYFFEHAWFDESIKISLIQSSVPFPIYWIKFASALDCHLWQKHTTINLLLNRTVPMCCDSAHLKTANHIRLRLKFWLDEVIKCVLVHLKPFKHIQLDWGYSNKWIYKNTRLRWRSANYVIYSTLDTVHSKESKDS